MSLYTNRHRHRHRPPRPAAAALWYDCSMLPEDETVFVVPHDRGRRFFGNDEHYGGALSRDQTPTPELSDLLNQRLPHHDHHHFLLQDRTVILNPLRRRISGGGGLGLSEETIANHITRAVHHHHRDHQNDAVSDEDGFCVVCQENLHLVEENGRMARLDCGHEYHFNCIYKWLNLSNTCPLCKATVLLPS